MKKFFSKLVSENSEVSSKRVISLLGLLVLTIGFMADLFWDYKVEESTFTSIETIVEIGMGAIVAEKFSKMKTEKTPPVEPKKEDDEIDLKL